MVGRRYHIHSYKIIITLIERVLGELISIYYRMLPPNVSSIFQKLLLGATCYTRTYAFPLDNLKSITNNHSRATYSGVERQKGPKPKFRKIEKIIGNNNH